MVPSLDEAEAEGDELGAGPDEYEAEAEGDELATGPLEYEAEAEALGTGPLEYEAEAEELGTGSSVVLLTSGGAVDEDEGSAVVEGW